MSVRLWAKVTPIPAKRLGAARFVFVDSVSVERPLMSHRVAQASLIVITMSVVVWWLEPWKLVIKTTIDEKLPAGAQTACLGMFSSHIHRTTGVARMVTLPGGLRILRLENLHTTQGPQLRVWLRDAAVVNGDSRCRRIPHTKHIDLGPLRANRGNTNYAIPHDADTAGLRSVILWCKRFGVSFGAAQLHTPIPISRTNRE